MYLAAAGVGHLGLVDFDQVDLSNLQRQVVYTNRDIGFSKAEAAKKRLESMNDLIEVVAYPEKLSVENATQLLSRYDVIVDGTDQFSAHYLINDACVLMNKPLVYGNLSRFEGLLSTVLPGQGPCYRCLYPISPPPDFIPPCAEGGVLGVLPGTIGMLQATEVLKLLLKIGKSLSGRILLFNGLETTFREMKLSRDPNCPVCGDHPQIKNLDREEFKSCTTACLKRCDRPHSSEDVEAQRSPAQTGLLKQPASEKTSP